jgi:hypothetical protein
MRQEATVSPASTSNNRQRWSIRTLTFDRKLQCLSRRVNQLLPCCPHLRLDSHQLYIARHHRSIEDDVEIRMILVMQAFAAAAAAGVDKSRMRVSVGICAE